MESERWIFKQRNRAAETWCKWMHPAPMWPIHGQYQCPKCLRYHPVSWENKEAEPGTADAVPVPLGSRSSADAVA